MSPLHGVHSSSLHQSAGRIFAFVAGHLVSMAFGFWTILCKGNRWFPLHPFLSNAATDAPRIRPRAGNPRSGSAAPALVNGRSTIRPSPPLLALRGDPHLRTPAKAIRDGDGRKGSRNVVGKCENKPHKAAITHKRTDIARCYVNVSWRLHRDSLPTTASSSGVRVDTGRSCKPL